MKGWLLLGCGLASFACVSRQSVDGLTKQVADLEQENYQLRKDLTEARVRLEMEKAGEKRTAAGQASAQPARPDTVPLASPEPAGAPRVVYSEPITDTSNLAWGRDPAGSEPARLMKSARERLDANDPEGALVMFRRILAEHPGSALADDAQFGVGECRFQMGKYEEAIGEYQKVVNEFPFGDQVPSAFLKIGFAHLAREQRDLALDSFKTVSEAYPGTEAATVARQQIAHLSRLNSAESGRKATSGKP